MRLHQTHRISVIDIAIASGYESESSFGALFKKVMGLSAGNTVEFVRLHRWNSTKRLVLKSRLRYERQMKGFHCQGFDIATRKLPMNRIENRGLRMAQLLELF